MEKEDHESDGVSFHVHYVIVFTDDTLLYLSMKSRSITH